MLEQIKKLIESTEGLEVNFKVGKESVLTIKGDFLTMAKLAADITKMESDDSEKSLKIARLTQEIKDLER